MTVAQGTPSLIERCKAARKRISDGHAPMRIPVDMTDPDVVLAECEMELERLSAQVVEYQKELGIRQNMTPTTRFNNICKALEEQKNDSPYSAESWDTLVAENDGLRAQVVELQKTVLWHQARWKWMDMNVDSTVTRASVPPSVSDGGTE